MSDRKTRTRRLFQFALLLAGLGLLGWIFTSAGWPAVAANLASIGGWFLALVGLYLWAEVAFVAGWWLVTEPRLPLSFFPRLLGLYLAGNTANYLAPGSVAGEPLKVGLLAERLGTPGAAASTTLHKHAHLFAQTAFVSAGVAFSAWRFHLPAVVKIAGEAGALLLASFLFLMTFALRRGAFSPLIGRIAAWRPLSERVKKFQEGALHLDSRIRDFHREHPVRFWASVVCCGLGFCGGLLETYLVVRLLSPERGLAAAVALETLSMAANNLLLFIPGRIGGAEGVRVGVSMVLGLTKAQGAAYSLVRRAREILWVLLGLFLFLHRQARRIASPAAQPKTPVGSEARG
jgi:hypothetical protein